MAAHVTDLEDRATKLRSDFVKLMPAQHFNPREKDPIGQAWNNARLKASAANDAIACLGDLLREKAGVTDRGPYEVVQVDYDGEYPAEGLAALAASSC